MDADETLTGTEVAIGAASCLGSLVAWIAPIIVIGGVGLLLSQMGSRTVPQSFGPDKTEWNSVGLLGMSLVLVAVGIFSGRGTLASLARVLRGQAGFLEIVFSRYQIIWLLIATGCWLGAAVILAGAVGIGPIMADY